MKSHTSSHAFITSIVARTVILWLMVAGLSWAEPNLTTININEASAETIADTLKGIGLKRAQAIVSWRENNGAFTHIQQLTAIKGIGESTLAKNDELIRLK